MAGVELARTLAEAIWHMLTTEEPFVRRSHAALWAPDDPKLRWTTDEISHPT